MLALPAALLATPAAAAPMAWLPTDWLTTGLLALIALALCGSLTLSALLLRRTRPVAAPAPPPPTGPSAAELEEMRRSVTAFASALREGTALLLQQQQETLEAVQHVAAHSQQLIALIAGCEERTTNATARAEILATRVARSAAAEVKASVESLTAISARIEYQARALEEATRPVGVRAA
ncbi:MAG: hypothetical protein K5Q68_13720 [Roseococcus sp.]|nr:hypothetical protein [Roseococcus sp.]